MRRGLIDSLKFAVAECDYRYDRIKKGEREKKTRDLEEGNVKGEKKSKRKDDEGCHRRISIVYTHWCVCLWEGVCVLFVCWLCIYTHRYGGRVWSQCTVAIIRSYCEAPFSGVLHRSTLCCSSVLPLITHFWLTRLKARGMCLACP